MRCLHECSGKHQTAIASSTFCLTFLREVWINFYGRQPLGWCCGCGSYPIDGSVEECTMLLSSVLSLYQVMTLIVLQILHESLLLKWLSMCCWYLHLAALMPFLVLMQVSLLTAASQALIRAHKSQSCYGFWLGNTLMV